MIGEAFRGCWLTIHFVSTYHPGSFQGEPVIPRWLVLNTDVRSCVLEERRIVAVAQQFAQQWKHPTPVPNVIKARPLRFME